LRSVDERLPVRFESAFHTLSRHRALLVDDCCFRVLAGLSQWRRRARLCLCSLPGDISGIFVKRLEHRGNG
jgi:hypothetical protein